MLILLSVSGNLGCLCLGCCDSCCCEHWGAFILPNYSFLRYMPRSEVVGLRGSCSFNVSRNLRAVSMVAVPVYIPTSSTQGPPFSTSSAVLVISGLFGDSYLTGVRWYVIVLLIEFPRCLMMLIVFSCSCWPSVCLLWWSVCSGLLPIFKGAAFWSWGVCVFCILTHIYHTKCYLQLH